MRHHTTRFVVATAVSWALSLFLAPSRSDAQILSTAKTWQRWEQTLSTSKSYAGCNPYRDVVLTVTYTSPSGQTYTGYGFWDGTDPANPSNTLFKLRASFPTGGDWTWVTQRTGGPAGDLCGSDPALVPVGGGRVTVTASGPGRPPIQTQGGLQVNAAAPNAKRYLVHSNGTPFYWLGDTNWFGAWLATPIDWSKYLAQAGPPPGRRHKGFTVIQISMPLAGVSGSQTQPLDYAGQKPFVDNACAGAIPNACSRWNPTFWREYERKVNEANNNGFVVVIVGLFKRVVETKAGVEQPWPALTEAKIYARNVVARLGGNHVIFSPGFDGAPSSPSLPLSEMDPSCNNTGVGNVNLACRARSIGNVIRNTLVQKTDVTKAPLIGLVTHHIGGGCKPDGTCCTADHWLAIFQSESWLDFQLFQSGQGLNCSGATQLNCLTERARERPQGLYAISSPMKPNVNGEGIYDADLTPPTEPYSATRARQVGYYSALSGAFGYTLGVAGTWDWGTVTGRTLTQALDADSSDQMKLMCTLFRNLEWHKLVPAPAKVFAQPVTTTCNPTGSNEATKIVYAHDATAGGGRLGLAYLPTGSSTTLELDTAGLLSFGTSWCQQWFNPRTGTYGADFNGTPVAGTTRYRFTKPDGNDWVLLLKDSTQACWTTPPKFCPCLTASGGQYVCATVP